MNYVILLVILAVVVTTCYLSVRLLLSARGSRLYNSVAYVGLIGSANSFLYIINTFVNSNVLFLIISVVMTLFSLMIYYLWRVTYNQIGKNAYHLFIWVLILIQFASDVVVYSDYQLLLPVFESLSKYHVLSNIVLLFTTIQYFQFSKMNNTAELNFIPIVLIIYVMSHFASFLTIGNTSILFNALMSVSLLLMIYFYYKDYKRSFYY